MAPKSLTVLFYSMDGVGHINACIGIAQALASRGHRIIFLVNADAHFKVPLEQYGFEQIATHEPKPKNPEIKPSMKEFIGEFLKSGMFSSKSSLEKIKIIKKVGFLGKNYELLVALNGQVEQSLKSAKPDLIVIDQFLVAPAVFASSIPYVAILSGNPSMLFNAAGHKVPPSCSGYPAQSDPSTWTEFQTAWEDSFLHPINQYQAQLNEKFGYKPSPEHEAKQKLLLSPYLTIYGYPLELDYQDIAKLSNDNFVQVDAFCRTIPEHFEVPEKLANRKLDQKLIYVSLGSFGGIDVELMKRIVAILGKTKHKYIVSKGPLAAEYSLPENCWGEASLPQTKILPLVDLVITHGGNNTVTETFTFGKPMIVMPLFADQFDNAQRVQEKGYGLRLDLYEYTESQLIEGINKLLNDKDIIWKLKVAAERIEKSNSKEKACIRLEKLANSK